MSDRKGGDPALSHLICQLRNFFQAPNVIGNYIFGLPGMWKKRKEIQARRSVMAWEIRKVMEKGWPRRGGDG